MSLAYKQQIDEVCKSLPDLGLKHFVMYIIFNNGSTFVLSNVYPILKAYYQDALFKEDYTYTPEWIKPIPKGYYLCDETQTLSPRLKELLAEHYKIYPAYNIIRPHVECSFVFSAIREIPTKNGHLFYEKTISAFEEFCIRFVDTFLDLIISCNPTYRYSFILTNKMLRDAVIKQGYDEEITLTSREQECLIMASQGKSAKEIARILNRSFYTVEIHLKKIRKLFGCNSFSAIMMECIHRGIIGNVSPFNNKQRERLLHNEPHFARPLIIQSGIVKM